MQLNSALTGRSFAPYLLLVFNNLKGGDQMNDPEQSLKAGSGANPKVMIDIWSSHAGDAL